MDKIYLAKVGTYHDLVNAYRTSTQISSSSIQTFHHKLVSLQKKLFDLVFAAPFSIQTRSNLEVSFHYEILKLGRTRLSRGNKDARPGIQDGMLCGPGYRYVMESSNHYLGFVAPLVVDGQSCQIFPSSGHLWPTLRSLDNFRR